MTETTRLRRGSALVAGASLVSVPLAFLPSTATAAPGDVCTDQHNDAYEVIDGICEIVFDEVGEFSLDAPESVTKLSAVLVGGGGGSFYDNGGYAGGGGEVKYINNVNTSVLISIEVGEGGDGGADTSVGGDTTVNGVTAHGGGIGDSSLYGTGAPSGNGNPGGNFQVNEDDFGGGGAGGAADGEIGGVGKAASAVATDHHLFPVANNEPLLGPGGSSGVLVSTPDIAGAGANFGTGIDDYEDGKGGIVIFRWDADGVDDSDSSDEETGLPETGAPMAPWALVAGMAGAAGGAAMLTRRRRVSE